MNINQKFLQEAQDLEAKWAKSGLLLKDLKQIRIKSSLLECERLINEKVTCETCPRNKKSITPSTKQYEHE
jgi:hypothetical protein